MSKIKVVSLQVSLHFVRADAGLHCTASLRNNPWRSSWVICRSLGDEARVVNAPSGSIIRPKGPGGKAGNDRPSSAVGKEIGRSDG